MMIAEKTFRYLRMETSTFNKKKDWGREWENERESEREREWERPLAEPPFNTSINQFLYKDFLLANHPSYLVLPLNQNCLPVSNCFVHLPFTLLLIRFSPLTLHILSSLQEGEEGGWERMKLRPFKVLKDPQVFVPDL